MRRLWTASIIIASLGFGFFGSNEQTLAADENGNWEAPYDVTCVEFLQRAKDESAARARVNNPERDVIYDRLYDRYYNYILGMVHGFNAGRPGVANVYPKISHATIIELVRRQCDLDITNFLPGAVLKAINANKSNWKLNSSSPNSPGNQTGTAR